MKEGGGTSEAYGGGIPDMVPKPSQIPGRVRGSQPIFQSMVLIHDDDSPLVHGSIR